MDSKLSHLMLLTGGTRFFSVNKSQEFLFIISVSPYDLTDYHMARRGIKDIRWDIVRKGKVMLQVEPESCNEDEAEFREVIDELLEADKDARLRPKKVRY